MYSCFILVKRTHRNADAINYSMAVSEYLLHLFLIFGIYNDNA